VRRRQHTAPPLAALAAAAAGLAWVFRPAGPPAPKLAAPLVEVAPAGPLDARTAAVTRLLVRKHALTNELLAGRLGLADAVERVLAAEAGEPLAQEEARRTRGRNYPGVPEREAVARNLVHCAADRLPDPAARQAVAGRLGREQDAYLRGTGAADPSRPSPHGPGGYGPPFGRSPS
jgi:hypothetical protein